MKTLIYSKNNFDSVKAIVCVVVVGGGSAEALMDSGQNL